MKVKELIAELQKCDPEATVNTNDGDIHFIHEMPGYYDGHYEELIKDEKGYNIGVRFTRAGKSKVCIINESYESLLMECDTNEAMAKLVWEFDKSLDISTVENIKKSINEARKKAVVVNDQVFGKK